MILKNIVLCISLFTILSCSNEENENCTKNYIDNTDIKLSKITIIFKNQNVEESTVFEINSNNQITSEKYEDIYSKDFIYNNCEKLIKRDIIYFNDPDRTSENYTEYDSDGYFSKHKRGNYSIRVLNKNNTNEIEVKATLAGNAQYQTNGIWNFNNSNELISDGAYEYNFDNGNITIQEHKNTNKKSTAEYYDILNPISILKKNTFGKRNIFFYASDTQNTQYFFDDKVLDNSINLPEKILSYDQSVSGAESNISIRILKQEGNLATNFIMEYREGSSSNLIKSFEYIVETN